jgi:hypothetical protein
MDTPLEDIIRRKMDELGVPSSRGAALIFKERLRQITEEGFTPERDAAYVNGELARAGAAFAQIATEVPLHPDYLHKVPYWLADLWPWDNTWWKPSNDPVRNLVKAGALIAAELDRALDQMEQELKAVDQG